MTMTGACILEGAWEWTRRREGRTGCVGDDAKRGICFLKSAG